MPEAVTTATVILSQLRSDAWTSLDDLMGAVRMRHKVGYFGVLVALSRLRKDGKIERRGKKGSYELRLLTSKPPEAP